jgi:hypothetical protein
MNSKEHYREMREKILAAMSSAEDKLIAEGIRTDEPLVVSQNGEVELVPAREIADGLAAARKLEAERGGLHYEDCDD